MDILEDDSILIEGGEKSKHASKKMSSDKAALLVSSGDEDEDEDIPRSGQIVPSVDCEEGDSVSASDEEVSAFTGEQETYIGDDKSSDVDDTPAAEGVKYPEEKQVAKPTEVIFSFPAQIS